MIVDLAVPGHLAASLFRPIRALAGPFHRRLPTLSKELAESEDSLPPLPAPWDDPRWYPRDFPPREHNRVTPLVHGEEYFSNLLDSVSTAKKRVTIAGWCLTPFMQLRRDGQAGDSRLADVLLDVSDRAEIFLLVWAGAPGLFQPTTSEVEEDARRLCETAPKVKLVLDRRAKFSHDHHQKAVTIDGRIAYVGGMDLSTYQGDRWDVSPHPLRFGPNWHDAQLRLEGEVVGDVEENFCQRWNECSNEPLEPLKTPAPKSGWTTHAQVIRTVPAGVYSFAPGGTYGIYHALITAIRQAKRFIYLENQYIWSPEVVEALVDAMNAPRDGPFRIVLLLPAHAYTGRYDNDRHVALLRDADRGRGIFEAYAPYSAGPAWGKTGYRYNPIYVHAKVSIVDDAWLSVGSANLNRRGLATDTEMNVQAFPADAARDLRCRLWAEHLGMPTEEVEKRDPIQLIDNEWKSVAERMLADMRNGSPPQGGQVIRYQVKRGLEGRLLDFAQSLSLEH